MLSVRQIKMRQGGLSATDMSRLSGENPYAGPIAVFEEKTMAIEELIERSKKPSDREMTGQILEAGAAKRYVYELAQKKVDVRILRYKFTVRHPTVSWAMATPDRLVREVCISESVPAWLLECKCVGSRTAEDWTTNPMGQETDADCVPPYVYVQCQWQMFVCDYDRCDVAAFLGGTEFRMFRLDRDEEYIQALVKIGEKFWVENVQKRIPPEPDGTSKYSEYLSRRFPFPRRGVEIPSTDQIDALAAECVEWQRKESKAKREKDMRRQALKLAMGDAEFVVGAWGRVSWRMEDSHKVDWDDLVSDLGITKDVLEKYNMPPARTLRLRQMKKEKK